MDGALKEADGVGKPLVLQGRWWADVGEVARCGELVCGEGLWATDGRVG